MRRIKKNVTEIDYENGVTILLSYETIVAAFVPGKGALCSSKKYGTNTTRHVNDAVKRWGCSRHTVDQAILEEYFQGC